VSYVLTCPNCGPREVTDFAFGGEVNPRPRERPSLRELGEYNYFRRNVAGVQREWWLHRSGCGEWFIAERDTRTNEVMVTVLPADAEAAGSTTAGAAAGGADGTGAAGGLPGSGIAGGHGT
jgi:sarcosine oxidase subunit delta